MVWPTEFDSKLDDFDATELLEHQLKASHAITPLDYMINLDLKAEIGCVRLTGIFACMGKSTNDVEIMERMIAAGMNVAVINLCFGSKEEHIETIKMLRLAAKNISDSMGKTCPLAIAARLSGRKIRTGKIADLYDEQVELKTDESVRLTTDDTYKERCSMYTIYVDYIDFADQVKKGDCILLDNEKILMKVDVISSTTVTCKIEKGGFLGSYKDVFVPYVVFNMPNYSEKDKLDIAWAIQNQVDIFIVPFVHTSSPIVQLKKRLGDKAKKVSIIATIQSIVGYYEFDEILLVADGIMISRQELGTDITPNKIIIAQKNMIAMANKGNVPVCVCEHVLSSMRYHTYPLRSELLDVANCILDGADAILLSAETAVGICPIDVVTTLTLTCKEAETCFWSKQIYNDFIDKTPLPCNESTGATLAAALAAQRTLASAIIVVTSSGRAAQLVARYRPRCPILAVTRYAAIARQLHLYRGVVPIIYEDSPDADWEKDIEKRSSVGIKWALARGFVKTGDPIVIVFGWKQGAGTTNSLKIVYATDSKPIGSSFIETTSLK